MTDESKRIIRIEDKLDNVKDSIASINTTLAAQHESLKEHMSRTKQLEEEFKPVRNHVIRLQGIVKFLGVMAVLAAIAEGWAVFMEYLKK